MSTVNVCFQSELEIAKEDLLLQIQKIGDTITFLIVPVVKEQAGGVTLKEIIEDISKLMSVFGESFSMSEDTVNDTLGTIMKAGQKIRFYLKSAYLYRETKGKETIAMEYAFGIGVKFEEEQSNSFSLKNLSFCVWDFSCNAKDEAEVQAAKERRAIIENRMGIVDLSSKDNIMMYLKGKKDPEQLELKPESGSGKAKTAAKNTANKKTVKKETENKDTENKEAVNKEAVNKEAGELEDKQSAK